MSGHGRNLRPDGPSGSSTTAEKRLLYVVGDASLVGLKRKKQATRETEGETRPCSEECFSSWDSRTRRQIWELLLGEARAHAL